MVTGKTTATNSRGNSALIRTLFILGLIIFVAAGWVLWRQVLSSPRNVFESMLEGNLLTRSVGKEVTQTNGQQKLVQRLQLQSGQQNIVGAHTTLSQEGGESATVKTESIGTPVDDYVRYNDIETTQKNKSGGKLDFSEIIGLWGRSQKQPGNKLTSGELYGEAVLGIVPFGYVPATKRESIMQLIKEKEVYKVDYATVEKTKQNGRPIYVYNVEVKPEAYVTMLKEFASTVGLTQLETFDPAAFKDTQTLNFQMSVDVWSRRLLRVEFKDSGRSETYGSYGAKNTVVIPTDTIPVQTLQQRLQAVQ